MYCADFITWQINFIYTRMEKIFGVVILYNPTAEVKQNIISYLPWVQKLLIIDNSEPASAMDFDFPKDKVLVIADGENKGIAARLNQAASYAIEENATWLLTMDQDSFFDHNNLTLYGNCFKSYSEKDRIAMFGVEFEQVPEISDCDIVETDMLITSGSLVNLDVCQKIGGFDEALFIDEVDAEYCFRAITKGYKTVKFNNVFLNHSLGTIVQHRSLKSFKKTNRTLHTPIRVYYMVRNYMYVAHKYQQDMPSSFPYRKKAILNRIKNNIIYGRNKLTILKYLFLAYRHYKLGRMGKFKS